MFLTLMSEDGAAQRPRHRLAIDDVLGLEHLDQVAVSPDGEWIAAVIQRPARLGEVYGRTAYETDPSRDDVWLISRRTGEQRNITNGVSLAAGFWCATWSPDGQRLAMLSTRPEGNEPKGGDNVRLYTWDRRSDELTRIGTAAVMTQTRYGAAIHKLNLRGGANGSSMPFRCGEEENAPFLWLDEHRLLAVMLPPGQISGLLDEADRPYRVQAQDAQRLRSGDIPTVESVGSGNERMPPPSDALAGINVIDVASRVSAPIASVPAYPFRGDLSLVVSPDRRRVAVLATRSAFAPASGRRFPHGDEDGWTAEKRLGVVALSGSAPIHWLILPHESSYPLDLFGWSPDGRHLAFRSRSDPFASDPLLLIATPDTDRIITVEAASMGNAATRASERDESQFIWLDNHQMLARMRDRKIDGHAPWRVIAIDGSMKRIDAPWQEPPAAFRRVANGQFAGVSDGKLYSFDPTTYHVTVIADVGGKNPYFLPSNGQARKAPELVIGTTSDDGTQTVQSFRRLGTWKTFSTRLPKMASPLLASNGRVLWQQRDRTGLFLHATDLESSASISLLSLNKGLSSVAWGQTQIIDYRAEDGAPLKGAVILPPDYQPGHRYPTLVWVYPGNRVLAEGDYWLDPQMPGLYNLQLYAAAGYAVLIPSMPLPRVGQRQDVYSKVMPGVMPAIDELVRIGIADPDRLGVMGQSFGGYSVYALISQTDRFKAAVAIAGVTDLIGFYGAFDPLARGYPGISHEKSSNWIIAEQFGLYASPTDTWTDYLTNSPLTYADRVKTPLLMIHGEHDVRGPAAQAEQFFNTLNSLGKTARLLRYGGESHSIAQSPANVRDAEGQMVGWFDRYLQAGKIMPTWRYRNNTQRCVGANPTR